MTGPSSSCRDPGRLCHRRRDPVLSGREQFNLVGRAPAIEWVEFHASTGEWDVKVERDERTALRTDGKRKSYRFQLQGPNAMKVMEAATAPDAGLKFFNMSYVTSRASPCGRCATAWRASRASSCSAHGKTARRCAWRWSRPARPMACVWSAAAPIRPTPSNRLDPVAAARGVHRRRLQGFREWARQQLRGQVLDRRQLRVRQYRGLLPDAVGPGLRPLVKFDHDFIGREALERKARQPQRRKVTLALDVKKHTACDELFIPE